MAVPNWYIGRTSRFFAAGETTYAAAASLAASNAVRVTKALLEFDPHKYRPSPQRFTDPSQRALLLGRFDAKFSIEGLLYPSGTVNTLPEQDVFLANGVGAAAVNITLSTTFTAAATTVTSGTVASATGLLKGQFIQIKLLATGVIYARRLTDVTGAVLTWSPPLPTAPATSDPVLGAVTYTPATALAKSIDMASYPHAPAASTPARELLGGVVDKMVFSIDGNSEPKFVFSGPGATFAGSAPNYTPQSEPGAWTVVGSESGIPNGMTTTVTIWDGSTLKVMEITKLENTFENSMELHNVALGTNKANASERKGKRKVTIKATALVSDDLTLWTPSLSADMTTQREVLLQIGGTSGYIWAFSWPITVVAAPPSIPDTDEFQNWDFMLTALASAGNDEMLIGQM